MFAAEAAVDDPAGLFVDRCDVDGADMSGLIDPHRRDAGGVEIVLGEFVLVALVAHAPDAMRPRFAAMHQAYRPSACDHFNRDLRGSQ
ncbi:hypothetical protein [Bradyrhizobium sp. AZCC 2230]|uniref:hypothetical protein n=1 Tax=Bradyrhizobium sp. AZCC 2230 TaxID=3117021 RepID=UPI002FEEA170